MTTVVDALSIPCSPRTKREADLKELSVQQREKTMGRLDHERVHSVKHRQPHTHTYPTTNPCLDGLTGT